MKLVVITMLVVPSVALGDARIYSIDEEDAPRIAMTIGQESERSAGIGIFQRSTRSPYATFLDKDGDGVFDLLTYSVLDAEGKRIMEVEDYGMDGQADFRLNVSDQTAQVFYEGAWRDVIGVGSSQTYVEIGGRRIELSEILKELGRDDF